MKTQVFPLPGARAKSRAGSTLRRVQRLQGTPVASRILGIDPGLRTTGYGVIEMRSAECGVRKSGAIGTRALPRVPHFVQGGTIKANENDELPERLAQLYDGMREVLREHEVEVVVIEELFSTYAHPRSALLMAHARGALMLAAQQSGARVHTFLPNEVKQVITGNGHATKSAMQAAVRQRLNLKTTPHPHDIADALAIALCYAARQDIGELMG